MSDKDVLQRFTESCPLVVMTRLILDEMLGEELQTVFKENRGQNYERDVLFSDLCTAMCDVILKFCPSPNQAYVKHQEKLAVSKTAFYNKLQNVGLTLSRSVVQHSYQKARNMLDEMNVPKWSYLSGYHTKIIDGNSISAGDNRLKELRKTWQKALPGKSVVVMDGDRQLIQDIHLLEDGQAQERTVLGDILETLEKKDLVFADSAYCTIAFLCGIERKQACFIVRQHGTLKGELLGKRKASGQSETGKLFEQSIRTGGADGCVFRRVTIELFEPTIDGDEIIHLLTNLPASKADAEVVSNLYRLRWEIEHKFYIAQVAMRCEVDSLNYPKANLFVFCLAMLVLNCRQVLFGALFQAFGEEIEEEASNFSISVEIDRGFGGLLIALDDQAWQSIIPDELADRMKFLVKVAKHYDRDRHRKSLRGPKRPPPKKSKYRNGHHLSIQKILDARKGSQTC